MIRHYLTFAHEALLLDEGLRGWHLAECWSQEKNALVLRFIQGRESRFVEVALDPQLGYALMRDEVHRARRNTIDFFGELLGKEVKGATIDEGERAITIHFSGGDELAIFFFGGGGGNILLLRDWRVIDSFTKYSGEYDTIISGRAEHDIRSPDDLRATIRGIHEPPSRALTRAIPELGKRLAAEALFRRGLVGAAALGDLDDATLDALFAEIDQLYGAAEASETFHLYHLPDEVIFSLVELRSLELQAVRTETFGRLDRAVRGYRSASFHGRSFTALRDRIFKRLTTERTRLERSLANRLDSTTQRKRGEEWEKQGTLLMSNLHGVEKGSTKVTLKDWEGEEREITLDARLTPVENAERYFRKARGARDSIERGSAGIQRNRRTLERIAGLLERAEKATGSDELERIEQENKDLFTMAAEAKEPGTPERFRKFEVAGGHEVYAGKNAANNDELTVRFARPNDYWFHARGSSGSHVVLRWSDPKSKPPRDAIRGAASIAAYYSGARGAKMVPVAYTLKKHVRKPRGAAPGAVMMEREEVVMVEPKLPPGSSDDV
ncbi:MAG: NFACT RNA binding domain-containing protein [Candidatus Kapaibacterium sp.]